MYLNIYVIGDLYDLDTQKVGVRKKIQKPRKLEKNN